MRRAQSGIDAIGGERLGKGDGVGLLAGRHHQPPGHTLGNKAGAPGRARGDHGQPARHGFEGDIAEGLGDAGVEEDVAAGERLPERLAGLEPGKDRAGQIGSEPAARRAVADHQHLVRHAARAQLDDRLGEHVEAFLHHQPPEEHDGDVRLGQPERAPPFGIAARGGEDRAIHSAAPQPDIGVHLHRQQLVDHALRRGDQRVAAGVEAPQQADDQRFEEGHVVIARIGFEPGVDRGEHRNVMILRPPQRRMARGIGRGDVDDIGLEGFQIALHRCANSGGQAILAASLHRHRHIGQADQIAGGLEIGIGDLGRIDAHLRAFGQQRADQAVQRLIGPVAGVVVVAAEQGNAKIGNLHGSARLG